MKEEQIKDQAVKYFGNELAATVWMNKYALKEDGQFREFDPSATFERMFLEICRIDEDYDDNLMDYHILSEMIHEKDFILGGSNLFGIGNNYSLTSLSNCYVVGNNTDSYGGICQTDQEQIQLMKRRAGVGHDLSHIRPRGTKVHNAAGSSTGIVSFMERYSNSTREVAQDGRRGALILTLDIRHPDAEDFLYAKNDLTKVTGANISLKITDDFMVAVINDTDFVQQFPVNSKDPTITKTIRAKDLWDKIIKQVHKSAEPGLVFWDTIIEGSPADVYAEYGFDTKSLNPCAELPLCQYDSCRLLAINLYNIVDNPFTENAKINYNKLRLIAKYSQVVMDDVVDLEKEKIVKILTKLHQANEPYEIKQVEIELWKKILTKLEQGRRTGIGIMGLADMFAAVNIQYGSEESIELASEVQSVISTICYKTSIMMGDTRGHFPIWNRDLEKTHPFLSRIFDQLSKDTMLQYDMYGRRSIANLTIAPTGTISILCGVSSGMEPVYNIYYERKVKVQTKEESTSVDVLGDYWKTYFVIHPKFQEWYRINYPNGDDLSTFSKDNLDKLILLSPYSNSCAYQIDPLTKVDLQAALQFWICHSISNTTNLPKESTPEDVEKVYMQAYLTGCKGITAYVDGSREGVLSINNDEEPEFNYHDAPKRPRDLPAELHQIKVKGDKYVAVIGLMNNKPYEIFCRRDDGDYAETTGLVRKVRKRRFDYITEHNGIPNLQDEETLLYRVVTIFTSALLRHGAKPQFIIHAIDKFGLDMSSLVSAIQRVLKKYVADGTKSHENCPECGEKLVYEGGCNICRTCGHSRCS